MQISIFVLILILILTCCITFVFMEYKYFFDGNFNIDTFAKKYNYPNKKIAVCYSGQIRNGYYQVLIIHKLFLIEPLNADVFCYFEDIDNNEIKKDIEKILKPKKIFYEKNDKNDKNHPEYINNISYNTFNMYKKMYYSNQLKKKYANENNIKYDYVIRIRPDIIIKDYLPLDIFNNYNNNDIYIPTDFKNQFQQCVESDWIAIGTDKCMDTYFNIYKYILTNTLNKCNISESLLYIFLKKEKINVIRIYDFPTFPTIIYKKKLDSIDNFFENINYSISLARRYSFENKNICSEQLNKLKN